MLTAAEARSASDKANSAAVEQEMDRFRPAATQAIKLAANQGSYQAIFCIDCKVERSQRLAGSARAWLESLGYKCSIRVYDEDGFDSRVYADVSW